MKIAGFAAREKRAGIARCRDRRLDEGAKIPAAPELILYAHSALSTEIPTPFGVDFPFEIECASTVGDVARGYEQSKDNPAKERVYR